jgi:hypothetical protein
VVAAEEEEEMAGSVLFRSVNDEVINMIFSKHFRNMFICK